MKGGRDAKLQQRFQEATAHHQAGRLRDAEKAYRSILEKNANHVDARQLLSIILAQSDRSEEAEVHLRRAIKLSGGSPPFWNNLGEICRLNNKLDDAEDSYRKAIAAAPGFAEAHYGLGNVLKQQGRDEEAVQSYRQALQLAPRHAKAHFNLANTLRDQGRVTLAVQEYEIALSCKPDWADAHLNLGNAQGELGNTDAAIFHYQRAIKLRPGDVDIENNLGDAFLKRGDVTNARASYDRALAARPDNWLRRLHRDAIQSVIPESNEAIDEQRTQLAAVLDQLIEAQLAMDATTLHSSGAEPPMLLTYQGRDDRPLREKYAKLFTPLIQPRKLTKRQGKPHVGIVVTNGHEGVFARCLGTLVDRLDRNKLDVTVLCSLAGRNVLSTMFLKTTDRYFVLPSGVEEAADKIAAAGFDLLHYWEIGTDSMNYFLPYYKPAPLQSTTWGWPITSGNPRVDFFLSARGLEPEDAAAHYVEQLVPFEAEPACYLRPPVPADLKDRAAWGHKETENLYLCAQNVRKYHPDFDAVLAGILDADPAGRLLLIADEQPNITEQLKTRLARSIGTNMDRVSILGRMERTEYLSVLALADVALDTLHYGGGANTVYDAIATGTPTVTLPGPYHRSRYAATTYRKIGVPEVVASSAAEYVRIATAIGTDRDYRQELKSKILPAGEQVFEDKAIIRAYEEFFLEQIASSRNA